MPQLFIHQRCVAKQTSSPETSLIHAVEVGAITEAAAVIAASHTEGYSMASWHPNAECRQELCALAETGQTAGCAASLKPLRRWRLRNATR